MFIIHEHTPASQLEDVTRATVRLVRNKKVEVFNVALSSTSLRQVEAAVDTLEAQYGTVLCLFEVDTAGARGKTLYKSMVEPWDLGVLS